MPAAKYKVKPNTNKSARSADAFGTNGGNGAYGMRKTADAGFDKPLATTQAGTFAATGKFNYPKTRSK